MKLTAADKRILDMLCWHVRVCRRTHLVRLGKLAGMKNSSAIMRRVAELISADLLQYAKVLCRPTLHFDRPLYVWELASGPPAYDQAGALAWQLEKRWNDLPLEDATIYYAGRRALNVLGGVMRGAVRAYAQISHDVQVTELYVHLLETAPERAKQWTSEDCNVEHLHGFKVPDAILYDADNNPLRAMEVGGFYDARKLIALMRDLEKRQIALELY